MILSDLFHKQATYNSTRSAQGAHCLSLVLTIPKLYFEAQAKPADIPRAFRYLFSRDAECRLLSTPLNLTLLNSPNSRT